MKKSEWTENTINAFLTYESNKDIASAIGKSVETVIRYKKNPEFQKILAQRRAEYVKTAVAKMQKNLSDIVDVVMDIINDPLSSQQVKLNACQIVFTQCSRWTETTDILERLENLENDNV